MNPHLKTDLSGYLLLNKPSGWTSFDCANFIKRKYKLKKTGHAGSLDPLAEGVLIIMVNDFTKYFDLFQNHNKSYLAKMLLGISFDSGDITGNIRNFNPLNNIPKEIEILNILNNFIGEHIQTPPKYSAIKINGLPAYKYALKGKNPDIKPRKTFIEKITLKEYLFPYITFEITCKKGFYVRSLCEDIASKLNTDGTLISLTRIEQSGHNLKEAIDLMNLPDNIIPCLHINIPN